MLIQDIYPAAGQHFAELDQGEANMGNANATCPQGGLKMAQVGRKDRVIVITKAGLGAMGPT